ncbi:MAG: DUF1080 domain-containing protein [Phycisphaerae bacterium]|nr:DUF1080 domain-containing protein [Phycisphaerae bacterium]
MFNRTLTITLLAAFLIAPSTSRAAEATSSAKCIATLKSADADLKAKNDACRELATIGDPKAIPVLVGLLGDEKLSHMARYALEPIADASVDSAFRDAMGALKGSLRVGVINSIGVRRDEKAVSALIALVKGSDKSAASAAIGSLGKIATPQALSTLAGCRKSPPSDLQWAIADASLAAAEYLIKQNKSADAVAIYTELNGETWPKQVRLGAFSGLLETEADKAPARIAAALTGKDKIVRAVAIAKIATLKGDGISARFASELPKLSSGAQVMLINALAGRKDAAARPAIVKAAGHDDPAVRTAAIQALGSLGDIACAKMLCDTIVGGKTDQEKQAAQSSLRALSVKGVDELLIKRLDSSQGDLKLQLLNILVDRKAALASSALITQAAGKDPKVSAAAFRGLGRIASPKDLPAILKLLTKTKDPAAGREAQLAVIAVSRKIEPPAAQADAVLAALKSAATTPAKCSLISVLGGIGSAKAFSAVKSAAGSDTAEIHDAAVRALTVWPDATAADTLLDIFSSTKNKTHRTLALRGAVRLLSLPGQDVEKTLDAYKKLLNNISQAGEIKLVLSGLGSVPDRGALKILEPYTKNRAVRREATAACQNVLKAIKTKPRDIVYTKLVKVVYGFGDKVQDVTGKVAGLKDAGGTIRLSNKYNTHFGDPAPGAFKDIVITFELNGETQTVKLIENTPITMKLAGGKTTPKTAPKTSSGAFTPLFDGKTLSGWKGRKSLWSVQDGTVVGQTTKDFVLKHNDFLYTEKEYGDFELTLSYKLENGNSGVQIRSQVHDDFRITGYQADIAVKRYTGILYDEGRRGIIADVKPAEISKFLKKGWNDYRIVCKGPEITLWINGKQTITYTEKKASIPAKGVIAFQLHRGPPMKVMFKDIKIKELN